ncbi:uncharacterized protein LOC108221791 [Daucus carota subsp. sativus]|uniref:uncharacterized protein LOC108221791 n=1 Tax=Daucus carota subsp. sativus TaxID=79200 RepID=UPI0007F039BE|nr:PREDICTED: uncharacterized protein LOC108221791 [Daucus carota subsp. sativus]
MAAQDVVCQGSRRPIGDGETTSVWKIPWLPCRDNGYLTTDIPQELENIRVVNLMETGRKRWDEDVLQDICNHRDATLRIFRFQCRTEDSWFWILEKSGCFSVKSCYRKLQGEQDWPLAAFWRYQGKSLILYGEFVELMQLMSCLIAHLQEWSGQMYEGQGLWHRRNRWVWDRISISEFGVQATAMNMLYEWRQSMLEKQKYKAVSSVSPRRWYPPQPGWVKVNIDAAVFIEAGCTSIGSTIRDEHGAFVRARNRKIAAVYQPREAEAVGLKEALSWVKDLGYKRCIFETDAKTVAEACKKVHGRAYFHLIVSSCVELFKHYDEVLVEFVHRSAR